MKKPTYTTAIAIITVAVTSMTPARGIDAVAVLPAPPQDLGLPYTRSGQSQALARLGGCIAVFPGSRYAYVNGFKVRLDNDAWRVEAFMEKGELQVPLAFVSLLGKGEVKPEPAPDALADRWVYDFPRAEGNLAGLPRVRKGGTDFVSLAAAADAMGLGLVRHPRGLVFVGKNPPTLEGLTDVQLDAVVTLFDTPEKFADPDIATRSVPTLKRQGKWTEHVKATPEQIAILEGPETDWPTVPKSEYDASGFNTKLLGSKVPVPGIYPRVLFSPEDVPMLAARLNGNRIGRMSMIETEELFKSSWWDPTTSDGAVFKKLYSGDLAGLEWDAAPGTPLSAYPHLFKGQKPGIYNSHIAYVPECLSAMALYCLLTNDDVRGRQAAAAIANYFKLREVLLDRWSELSDSEFGSTYQDDRGGTVSMEGNGARTHWRNLHGVVPNMNLGLALDFGGKWMTSAEKDMMRRIIAKATYGRRSYGQDAPVRFRDVNWVTWDLPQFLAVASIEGLSGFDPEVYASGAETARAFCDWGIDSSGVIYESNGKTPGGNQFQFLSMMTLARRGENLFCHPHFRKLLTAQIHSTSPSGRVIVNSGTQYGPYSPERLNPGLVRELKSFFPDDLRPDYLLTLTGEAQVSKEPFDEVAYRSQVKAMKRLRLPSITYPGMTRNMLYDSDTRPVSLEDLGLPLDFNDPVHGVFSSRSDAKPDAVWMHMLVRPDHYFGAGHHHADAGMFHFSGLGVDWFTESPFSQNYSGNYHNLVLVDGKSEPESFSNRPLGWQGAATYLGAGISPSTANAAADLTYSYSWRWLAQPQQTWEPEWANFPWEVEPSEANLKIFAGTARYKFRPWWPTYNYTNYLPNCRSPYNPMKFVHRQVGLVRGASAYGYVVDDLRKDDRTRLYQWTAMLNGGVWKADVPGLPENALALAGSGPMPSPTSAAAGPILHPADGEPILLVYAMGADAALLPNAERCEGPADKAGKAQFYDRLVAGHKGTAASFRMIFIPTRSGQALPEVSATGDSAVQIRWKGNTDVLQFSPSASGSTKVNILRNGKPIVQ